MPDTEVENLLAACERNLKSSNSDVRLGAVISLQEIGEPAAPLLLRATKDRTAKVSEAASQVLGGMGEVGFSTLHDMLRAEIMSKRKIGNRFAFRRLIFLLCFVVITCLSNIFFIIQSCDTRFISLRK